MTLLQHVKLRPVLPALKEMRMTLVDRLLVILSTDASRSTLFMDPSSVQDV